MTTVSTKPYLLRAIYDWCCDQGFTPHIAVVVDDNVMVPPGYARDGQIVLNIASGATVSMELGNDAITFQARFGGKSHHIYVPVSNVLAIYARENGQGMAFELDIESPAEHEATPHLSAVDGGTAGSSESTHHDDSDDTPPPPPKGSHLKVVK